MEKNNKLKKEEEKGEINIGKEKWEKQMKDRGEWQTDDEKKTIGDGERGKPTKSRKFIPLQ